MTGRPVHLQVEPSADCNLRCGMCANRVRADRRVSSPSVMPLESFERLLDEVSTPRDVHLQGLGEPLLNPWFLRMAGLAHQRGLVVSSTSNLACLDAATARALPGSGLDCLFVSVDSPSPVTYRRMRPGGDLRRVSANIRRVIAEREESRTGGPRVRITAVLTTANLGQLSGLVEMAHALGADGMDLQNLTDAMGERGRGAGYSAVRRFISRHSISDGLRGQAAAACRRAAERALEVGLELNLPPLEERPPVPCRWPWNTAYVTYRGDVLPCCMVGTPEVSCLGNAFESGFDAVWDGEGFRELRQRLSAGDPPEFCLTCSVHRGLF